MCVCVWVCILVTNSIFYFTERIFYEYNISSWPWTTQWILTWYSRDFSIGWSTFETPLRISLNVLCIHKSWNRDKFSWNVNPSGVILCKEISSLQFGGKKRHRDKICRNGECCTCTTLCFTRKDWTRKYQQYITCIEHYTVVTSCKHFANNCIRIRDYLPIPFLSISLSL